jgi:hypothetical protein
LFGISSARQYIAAPYLKQKISLKQKLVPRKKSGLERQCGKVSDVIRKHKLNRQKFELDQAIPLIKSYDQPKA